MGVVALLCRFTVACVVLRAGVVKLPDLDAFTSAVRDYALLPEGVVRPVSRAVPVIEVGCGLLLLVGVATGPVAALAALLLAGFAVAVAVNLVRGRRIRCGCAGGAASVISWRHVVANGCLVAAAAVASAWASQPLVVVAAWGWAGAPALSDGDGVAALFAATAASGVVVLVIQASRVRNAVTALPSRQQQPSPGEGPA